MEFINWIKYTKSISTNQYLNRLSYSTDRMYGYIKIVDQVYQFKLKNGHNRIFKLYELSKSLFYLKYELIINQLFDKIRQFSLVEISRGRPCEILITDQIPSPEDIKFIKIIFSRYYSKSMHQFCKDHKIFYVSVL